MSEGFMTTQTERDPESENLRAHLEASRNRLPAREPAISGVPTLSIPNIFSSRRQRKPDRHPWTGVTVSLIAEPGDPRARRN